MEFSGEKFNVCTKTREDIIYRKIHKRKLAILSKEYELINELINRLESYVKKIKYLKRKISTKGYCIVLILFLTLH